MLRRRIKGTPLDYQDRLKENLSWYRQNFQEIRLATPDGHSLRYSYQKLPDSRAAVIVVNGRTEYIEKYIEVLRDLQMDSMSFVIYDHSGQGDSGRLLADTEKGHIDTFDTYINDLQLVVQTSRDIFGSIPIHLLCHSMGGTIAWLHYAEHPGTVDSLILSAPMFSIETGIGIPLFMVESIARICCKNGMGNRYVATTGPFDHDMPFDDNELTADPNRFAFNLHLANSIPFAPIGGPTYCWLSEAFTAMRRTKKVNGSIDCPVYFLAGSEDRVVGLDIIEQMSLAVNGKYSVYEHARHELLMEVTETRNQVLNVVRDAFRGSRSGNAY